jgi:cell division septation protein DedD
MPIQIKPDMADRIKVSEEAHGDEPPPPRAGRNWRLIAGCALVVVLAVAAAVTAGRWLFGGSEQVARTAAEAPLVKADDAPVKVRPENPGGMQVPNRDMLVYRRLEGASEPPPVERLLPGAEQPVVPPRPVAAPGREPEPEPEAMDAEADSATAGERPEMEAFPNPVTEVEDEAATPEPPRVAAIPPRPVKTVKPEPAPVVEKPAANPIPAPVPAGGAYQVQLAALSSRDHAQASWSRLSKKHADVLGGLKADILRADLGEKGVIYRLRAGPAGDETAARSLCASLVARKVDCIVVRPGG